LRITIKNIISISGEIGSMATNLADASRQAGSVADDLAKSMSQVAEDTNLQLENSRIVLQIATNTKSKVLDGSIEIEKALESSELSTRVAGEGKDSMDKVVDKFNLIGDNFSPVENSRKCRRSY